MPHKTRDRTSSPFTISSTNKDCRRTPRWADKCRPWWHVPHARCSITSPSAFPCIGNKTLSPLSEYDALGPRRCDVLVGLPGKLERVQHSIPDVGQSLSSLKFAILKIFNEEFAF